VKHHGHHTSSHHLAYPREIQRDGKTLAICTYLPKFITSYPKRRRAHGGCPGPAQAPGGAPQCKIFLILTCYNFFCVFCNRKAHCSDKNLGVVPCKKHLSHNLFSIKKVFF